MLAVFCDTGPLGDSAPARVDWRLRRVKAGRSLVNEGSHKDATTVGFATRLVAGMAGAVLIMSSQGFGGDAGVKKKGIEYPTAPRDNTTDTYHGTVVADPFRPLEDPDSGGHGRGSRPRTRSRSGT